MIQLQGSCGGRVQPLKKIIMQYCNMDVDYTQMLLGSIRTNSTLRHVTLGKLYKFGDDDSYNTAMQSLESLVCNQSVVRALCP